MAAWVWISGAAALVQTLRFMLQRQMASTGLTVAGATFARFVYAAPVVALGTALYARASGQAPGLPNPAFWSYALTGAIMQIMATLAVVEVLTRRHFAVGITLMKTEVLQATLVGLILLGDRMPASALGAVVVGFAGVIFLSEDSGKGLRRLVRGLDRTAMLGLASGAMFGVSAVSYRGATLALDSGDAALRAGVTLAVVTIAQTLGMTIWFMARDPGQIGKVLRAWRGAGLIGVTSMLGSLGWFTAFSLQQAALVKAVAQVEVIFSVLASMLIFGERITGREWTGMILVATSVVAIVLTL